MVPQLTILTHVPSFPSLRGLMVVSLSAIRSSWSLSESMKSHKFLVKSIEKVDKNFKHLPHNKTCKNLYLRGFRKSELNYNLGFLKYIPKKRWIN